MGWFFRSSRNGIHVVYSQQTEDSCGIACVIMVNFKLKKWRLASTAVLAASEPIALPITAPIVASAFRDAVKSEEEVFAAYSRITGVPYDGTGVYGTILPRVLNELDIGHWVARHLQPDELAGTILDRPLKGSPCITLIEWRDGGENHWVVCDNVVSSDEGVSADFCDPFDAAVRTLSLHRGRNIVYKTTNVHQPGLDFGQTHAKYLTFAGQPRRKKGDMNGWIIYQTAA